MKQQPTVTVRIPEDLLRQVLYLCEAERRTPQNQILMLLRNSIGYFERAKGKMDRQKLNGYDISAYLPIEEGEAE